MKIISIIIVSLFIISQSLPVSGVIDYTNVGIKDGDEFEFILEKSVFPDGEDSPAIYDEETDKEYPINEGDIFTVRFVNATPYQDEYDDWVIDYEFIIDGNTIKDQVWLWDGLGSLVVPIEWDELIANAQAEIDDAKTNPDLGESFNGSITQTDSEVKYITSYSYTYEDETYSGDGEIRYDKKTGVSTYMSSKSSYKNSTGTYISELMFRQTSYNIGTNDDNILAELPGFSAYITFFALFALIFPIMKSRKKNT